MTAEIRGLKRHRPLLDGFLFCFLAQFMVRLPFLAASYVPAAGGRSVESSSAVLLLSFPVSFAVCSVLLLTIAAKGNKLTRFAAVVALLIAHGVAIVGTQYHLRFGVYPSMTLLRIALESPGVLIGYAGAGIYLLDVVVLVVTFGLVGWSVLRGSQLTFSAGNGKATLIIPVVTLMFTVPLAYIALGLQPSHRAVVQHSLPWLKWTADGLDLMQGRTLFAAEPYLPRKQMRVPPSSDLLRAEHVVVIVAECVRKDHLPWNGYAVETMPGMNHESPQWTRFKHSRANAVSTEESFPILMNNDYLAGLKRDPAGSRKLWAGLRNAGVRSGFFSGGAMEWAGLLELLSLSDADVLVTASTETKHETLPGLKLNLNYSISDEEVVRNWKSFLREATAKRQRSFAVVHLVGSHFPFAAAARKFRQATDQKTAGLEGSQGISLTTYESKLSLTNEGLGIIKDRYDRALGSIDESVMNMVRYVDSLGGASRTLFVFTADHGESFGERGYLFHGTNLFEEQIGIPIEFRVGGDLSGVRTKLDSMADSATISTIDIIPTVLDALGVQIPQEFEGYSLLQSDRKAYDVSTAVGLSRIFSVWNPHEQHIYSLATGEHWRLGTDGVASSAQPLFDYPRFTTFLESMLHQGILQRRAESD